MSPGHALLLQAKYHTCLHAVATCGQNWLLIDKLFDLLVSGRAYMNDGKVLPRVSGTGFTSSVGQQPCPSLGPPCPRSFATAQTALLGQRHANSRQNCSGVYTPEKQACCPKKLGQAGSRSMFGNLLLSVHEAYRHIHQERAVGFCRWPCQAPPLQHLAVLAKQAHHSTSSITTQASHCKLLF